MHGNLEPEERVFPNDDPYQGGDVYPATGSMTKLMGDIAKAFHESKWDPNAIFEVQQAGTWKKDRFIVIKNRSI